MSVNCNVCRNVNSGVTTTTRVSRSANCSTVNVSRTIYVDSVNGTELGDSTGTSCAYKCVNCAYRNAVLRASAEIPFTVYLRPGLHFMITPINLVGNVVVQGLSPETTFLYGSFNSNCMNKTQSSTLRDFSLVSYYTPAVTHSSDGTLNVRQMQVYHLNVAYAPDDPNRILGVATPPYINSPYPPRKFAFVATRGTLAVEDSKIEMDVGDPTGNSETAIIGVNNPTNNTATLPVVIRMERSTFNMHVANSATGAVNKNISTLYLNSTTNGPINVRAFNNIATHTMASTVDGGTNMQYVHTVNNTQAPAVEILSSNDRVEYFPRDSYVASATEPTQALIMMSENQATYLPQAFFRHNFTVPTIRYMSPAPARKYTVRSNSLLARVVLHQASITNLEQVPPIEFESSISHVNGAQAEADNLRNGAHVTTIAHLSTSVNGPVYVVKPIDSILQINANTGPMTVNLPALRADSVRDFQISNLTGSVANVTVAAAAGENIKYLGVIAPTITILPGQTVHITGPGSGVGIWDAEPIGF